MIPATRPQLPSRLYSLDVVRPLLVLPGRPPSEPGSSPSHLLRSARGPIPASRCLVRGEHLESMRTAVLAHAVDHTDWV